MKTAPERAATRIDAIRVLLVEDSLDHQMLSRRALERAGYSVEVAGSAEEALARLHDGEALPHLILVDQGLPRMSGTELLAHIVEIPDGPGAVMVTASADSQVAVSAMRLGAIDFLSKDQGYYDLLPSVVERAHRRYDLGRRTQELQRLALLVHASRDLDTVVEEVVSGACKLLGAVAAVLLQTGPEHAGQWRPVARVGDAGDLPDLGLLERIAIRGEVVEQGGILCVPLPDDGQERRGALIVGRTMPDTWLTEDRDLAQTFAAFAASALGHAHRAELERGLIQELQQTIRVRQDFVASVSHELRTPLTSIGGYAETILQHADRLDADRQLELVGRIKSNATSLERMIDQLIDVARLERGATFEAHLGDVPLLAGVANCLAELAPSFAGGAPTVDVPDLVVRADPELLHRVFANLLTNAVKYSPDGPEIHVRARAIGPVVRVEVRDHGIGIEDNDQANIFEPFWRAGYAVSQAVRGAGIGLALVREYVANMGGQLGVETPEDGVGSCFWFTLEIAGD